MGGWVGGCKPIIRHNSNSTLGGVELTWSGDGVEMELGVELELGNWRKLILTIEGEQKSLLMDLI